MGRVKGGGVVFPPHCGFGARFGIFVVFFAVFPKRRLQTVSEAEAAAVGGGSGVGCGSVVEDYIVDYPVFV